MPNDFAIDHAGNIRDRLASYIFFTLLQIMAYEVLEET